LSRFLYLIATFATVFGEIKFIYNTRSNEDTNSRDQEQTKVSTFRTEIETKTRTFRTNGWSVN